MNRREFKAEIEGIMPGYKWTVHNPALANTLVATGTQSIGSNRLSTLEIARSDTDDGVIYTARSSGYGRRAPWLHTHSDCTLARALRGLQCHFEMKASQYSSHATLLKRGRNRKVAVYGNN